jgi:replicative DNA helicase
LALSSQNRAQGQYGEGRGSANLDSLRYTGEYDADVVMLLHGSDQRSAMPPARAANLTIAKNRWGPQGAEEGGLIPLIFRADIGTFREETKAKVAA